MPSATLTHSTKTIGFCPSAQIFECKPSPADARRRPKQSHRYRPRRSAPGVCSCVSCRLDMWPALRFLLRLEWSALPEMTQRLPFQLVGYSRAPASYDEARRMRQPALAAVKPEKHDPVDVASMLVYARNIEALEHLRNRPDSGNCSTRPPHASETNMRRAQRLWRSPTDSIAKPNPFRC